MRSYCNLGDSRSWSLKFGFTYPASGTRLSGTGRSLDDGGKAREWSYRRVHRESVSVFEPVSRWDLYFGILAASSASVARREFLEGKEAHVVSLVVEMGFADSSTQQTYILTATTIPSSQWARIRDLQVTRSSPSFDGKWRWRSGMAIFAYRQLSQRRLHLLITVMFIQLFL